MATAQSKINSASLTSGMEILVCQDEHGFCSPSKTKGGTVILRVSGSYPNGNRTRLIEGTVNGKDASVVSSGIYTHHLATDRDRKRVAKAAPAAAPAEVPTVAEADENTVTIPGTVKRYGRTVPAQRTRTGDVYGPVQYRDGNDWRDAGKGVARTFQRTMTGEAPVKVAAPRFSDADKEMIKASHKIIGAILTPESDALRAATVRTVQPTETPRPHAAFTPGDAKLYRAVALSDYTVEATANAVNNFTALAASCKAAGNDKAASFWTLKAHNIRVIGRKLASA